MVINKNVKSSLREIFNWLEILAIFGISLWLIVIRPLGPNLSRLPGDLGDSRFNNYILEHDFRWITGQDSSLWNAPFSYPYPLTLTFSDNHFGSMLIYDFSRWSGLDRESALQSWYIISFLLNFVAVAYVLKKLKLKPLAIGIGAFFFTFGLPVLAQEGHVQLAYRFCIPLACLALWQFSQRPHFKQLVLLLLWWVWQFFLSIYLGFFLSLLLASVVVILPLTQDKPLNGYFHYWPRLFIQAWKSLKLKVGIVYLFLTISLLGALVYLLQTYATASKIYGFTRSWDEVIQMLPRIQSYFIADQSKLWKPFTFLSAGITSYRWEHQLFVGISVFLLLALGIVWRFKSPYRKLAFLFLGAAGVLVLLTLNVGGFSLYKLIWYLPGANSIRAITRIILVLMWPIAFFIAIELDALLNISNKKGGYSAIVLIFLALIVTESIFFNHITYSKKDSVTRLQTLREQLPTNLPKDPVLFVWNPENNPWYLSELDAMMLSQNLGWPVLNGYSGNLPQGYGPTKYCDQAAVRIIRYMNFAKITDQSIYKNLISRVVSIGPADCQLLKEVPTLSVTYFSGSFSPELFSGISINLLSLTKKENHLYIQIDIVNHSSQTLPAESSSGNPFRLSWRMLNAAQGDTMLGFDTRGDLISDIPAGEHALMTIVTVPPTEKGKYSVEVSAVQESIAWFHNRGMLPARSTQTINVDDSGQWTISN
jgi:hypothetical protein